MVPELKTEFADAGEKGAHVQQLLDVGTKAMKDADDKYNQYTYKEAHAEYIVSLDCFMHLMKLTKDDPNFQAYVKAKLNYLLDRVSFPCHSCLTNASCDREKNANLS